MFGSEVVIFSGAAPAVNDTVTMRFDTGLNNYYPASVSVTATAASGDTLAAFVGKMATAIGGNPTLSGYGLSASSSGTTLFITRSAPYGNYITLTTNFAAGINVSVQS